MTIETDILPISTPHLRALVDGGEVTAAEIQSVLEGGFIAKVVCGLSRCILQARRGEPRHFRTLDTAARYLHDLGIKQISINLEIMPDSQQDLFMKTRRLGRIKATHAAAA